MKKIAVTPAALNRILSTNMTSRGARASFVIMATVACAAMYHFAGVQAALGVLTAEVLAIAGTALYRLYFAPIDTDELMRQLTDGADVIEGGPSPYDGYDAKKDGTY